VLSTKNQAVKLRLQGKTYTEISESLHVPKSTLSGWLKNLILPPNIAHKLNVDARSVRSAVLIRRNKLQTVTAKKKASETRSDYSRLVGTISQRELLLIGASLYWGEGYKKLKKQEGRELTAHQVSFLNADPVMVKIFIKFLKESLGISEQSIKLTMRLYPGIHEAEAKLFWKEVTGLSSENFHKTLYLVSGASKGKRPSNTLPYGTLQISVYSTEKFYQILGLIEGIKKCA
jgi:hypothetical protein